MNPSTFFYVKETINHIDYLCYWNQKLHFHLLCLFNNSQCWSLNQSLSDWIIEPFFNDEKLLKKRKIGPCKQFLPSKEKILVQHTDLRCMILANRCNQNKTRLNYKFQFPEFIQNRVSFSHPETFSYWCSKDWISLLNLLEETLKTHQKYYQKDSLYL